MAEVIAYRGSWHSRNRPAWTRAIILAAAVLAATPGFFMAPRCAEAGASTVDILNGAAWKQEIRTIDELLLAKKWNDANRHACKILQNISSHVVLGGAQFFSVVLVERSVALAGLGRMHDAEWYACMADGFWSGSAQQFLRYGAIGARLLKILPSVKDASRAAHALVLDDGDGTVVVYADELKRGATGEEFMDAATEKKEHISPPIVVEKRQPHYPPGVAIKIGRGKDFVVVTATIGKDGIPREPRIERWSPYVVMAYATLDALKDWRFIPPTKNGKPFQTVYRLTARFDLIP